MDIVNHRKNQGRQISHDGAWGEDRDEAQW